MRETKTITTPSGIKVELKTYLTIGEVNDALRVIFKDQEATPGTDAKIPMLVGIERNIQLVIAAVVSLDDSNENLPERIKGLRLTDYNAIFAEVKELSEGAF